jgi:hypothetical protein
VGGSSDLSSNAADDEGAHNTTVERVVKPKAAASGPKGRAKPPLASLGGGGLSTQAAAPVGAQGGASRLTGLTKQPSATRGSISSIVRNALDSDTDEELDSSLDRSGHDRARLDDSDEFM